MRTQTKNGFQMSVRNGVGINSTPAALKNVTNGLIQVQSGGILFIFIGAI